MSCYHPLVGIPTGDGRFELHGARETDFFDYLRRRDNGNILIPCGRCIGCKLDYSRMWADRMMLELDAHDGKGVFLTLTYDDDHVPILFDEYDNSLGMTLDKRDCQLFMKRLRKEFKDKKIRFFASGEYGPTYGRPHMHLILFGVGLDDFSPLLLRGKNEIGQPYYCSGLLGKVWTSGFSLLSGVSWETCAYVARYVVKKIGTMYLSEPDPDGFTPEFSLMSRMPGIGRPYLDAYPDCLDYKTVSVSTEDGSKEISIPKYFLESFRLTDSERYEKMKLARREYADDRMLHKLLNTDVSLFEYFEVEEQNKISSVNALKRNKL